MREGPSNAEPAGGAGMCLGKRGEMELAEKSPGGSGFEHTGGRGAVDGAEIKDKMSFECAEGLFWLTVLTEPDRPPAPAPPIGAPYLIAHLAEDRPGRHRPDTPALQPFG
jgi:hypothetical protein